MEGRDMEPRWAKQLEEILGDRLSLELDFNNPKHELFFMEYHGGKDWMRKNSPQTYQAYLRTKENQRVGEDKDIYIIDYTALPPRIVPQPKEADKGREDTNNFCKINASIITNVKETVKGIVMKGFIRDDVSGRCHATIYEEFTETEITQKHYHVTADCFRTLNVNDTEGFITRGVIEYFSESKCIKTVAVQSRESQGAKIADMIESFEIVHPHSMHNPPNNPIRIVYKDRKDDKADHTYKDVTPVGKRVATCLPIEGIITLKEGFQADSFSAMETDDIQMTYAKTQHTYFGYTMEEMKSFFIKDSNTKIHFTFPDRWKGDMDSESYGWDVMTFLSCPFYYTVIDTNETGSSKKKYIPFLIHSENEIPSGESYYKSKESSEVIIPPIKYLWGCLGKDTRIRMADNSEKKISDVKKGDMVWVYEHTPLPVRQVVVGSESLMVRLDAENGAGLLLTVNHPVLTKRGVVRADKLNAADILILPNGKESPLKFVYEEAYDDQVYCLELESSHMICAGGLLAGDYNCQNDGYRTQVETMTEAEEFLKEMRFLRENAHE